MKTIHQMTTEEFMQVFEYNQNNKKAILFADKESAKDFIEVARKHGFSINEGFEIQKTYLPLYLSMDYEGLLYAYYLMQKEPLDSKDVIRYKKDSIWTLSDNEWIPLQRDTLLKFMNKLREKNAKKSEKKVEESIEKVDMSSTDKLLDKVINEYNILLQIGIDKVLEEIENFGEENTKKSEEKVEESIEKVDAPKSEFGYFEVDGKTVFAHRYSNCQKENAKKPEKEVKENMEKENGFPDITVTVDFDEVAKDWVKPTQTVKEIRKEVLIKELEKIAIVLNFLIELRIPVQPSLITVYNECLKELSEL